jgi:hypothetical protein
MSGVARGIGGRLVIVPEKDLVDGGADRRLLDHVAAADFAAHPVGPELPRLTLVDHAINIPPRPRLPEVRQSYLIALAVDMTLGGRGSH